MTGAEPSLRHLLGRLTLVEARVRRAVDLRRADDPAPDDPFRGLYLTPEAIDRVLAQGPAPLAPDALEAALAAGDPSIRALAFGDTLVLCTEALGAGEVEEIATALAGIWSILDDG